MHLDKIEVAAAAGVGRLAMAAVIGLSPTTLARRRRSGTLTTGESDRLVRVARLVGMTYELMRGDGETARRWLKEGMSSSKESRRLNARRLKWEAGKSSSLSDDSGTGSSVSAGSR